MLTCMLTERAERSSPPDPVSNDRSQTQGHVAETILIALSRM
jgi:hypothetical protein